MQKIMIKYGELTTKGQNRNLFINTLCNNIKYKTIDYDCKIKKDRSRMYIETDYINEVVEILKNIFGIHSIVLVTKVNTNNIDDISNTIITILKNEKFSTFKIVTNRADKNYSMNSLEVSKYVGEKVLTSINDISVDVHNPDLKINIDLRSEGVFIFTKEIPGLNGYPAGVGGKGLLMLSGGIDSPVAGYLALKRGIEVNCIYFASPPHTSDDALHKVKELVKKLCKYTNKINLYIVPFTKIQEEIYHVNSGSYMITILRRMMYRITESLAKKINAKVIINGESIGQVASQTLDSLSVINEVTNFPIIRPVACLDKLEIIDIANKIDTYETSILPYEDCCTIFLPKSPVIHPNLEKAISIENRFDFNTMIEETVDNIELITIDNKQKKLNELL